MTSKFYFWTRIWPNCRDGYSIGNKQWDDGNTVSGDGVKSMDSDQQRTDTLKSRNIKI